MTRISNSIPALVLSAVLTIGCGGPQQTPPDVIDEAEGDVPTRVIETASGISLAEPLAVARDFDGNLLVADGVAGRIIRFSASGDRALEFQAPTQGTGFYPSDVTLSGFFVYAIDSVNRLLVRFDNRANFRDILIDFNDTFQEGIISPVGLDVESTGRVAVTDIQNHQIILFDSYLQVELVFGSYGSFKGQLDSPEGVSFTPDGVVVVDSGNRRLQFFDERGRYLRTLPLENDPNPMRRPRRAVLDSNGRVFVADPVAGRVFVFDEHSKLTRTIRPKDAPRFEPTDVSVTGGGLIHVTDKVSGSLLVFK